MATLYNVDGSSKEVSPANGKEFTLEELQEIIGGYVEMRTSTTAYFLFDEEGRLKNLPLNPYFELSRFVGPVLRCKKEDKELPKPR